LDIVMVRNTVRDLLTRTSIVTQERIVMRCNITVSAERRSKAFNAFLMPM